jgi:2'-5' RNA ligase
MAVIRAFLALYPDTRAHEAIVAFRDGLRKSLPREGFRWAKDDQLHLTLRFMGELPDDRLLDLKPRMAQVCAHVSAFEVVAEFEGAPWKGARVVALRVTAKDERLMKLQEAVEAGVRVSGEPADPKAFNPHITLARLDNPRLQPSRPRTDVAQWEAREVVLVQSVLGDRGATHSVLARFPLQ